MDYEELIPNYSVFAENKNGQLIMDYRRLIPHFSESEIKKATDSLYKYDTEACSNNRIFDTAIKATYSGNYSGKSLKRTFLKECKIQNANFTGAAVTGSKFIQTLFEDCKISGAGFQCCDFIESKLQDFSFEIATSNFSNSIFIDTEFKNVNFCMNTISQSLFENCTFTDCKIGTTTLEGSVFSDCTFTNVDLSNLNIDYVTMYNPTMDNVTLPFFQIPYIINGFSYINTTDDNILIGSEKSLSKKINIKEYLQNTEKMIIHFCGLKEFFPLANIYLAKNDPKTALACIIEGIEYASKRNDFRMIKHFCRLVTSTIQFNTKDMKCVYNLLENRFNPEMLTAYELHNYLLNIGDIRTILLNGNYGLQTLEIVIQTNIDSNEVNRFSTFLEQLNKLLDEHNQNGRSQFVELRHNSKYNIRISCANTFKQLMPVLVSIYAVFGAFDKAIKFYDTLLDIEIKQNVIQNHKDSSQKEILEEQIKNLEFDIHKIAEIAEKNKTLSTDVLELTHYIKGIASQSTNSDLLYSKTTFDNQEKDEN
jgi:uncharacterized protein YjbI with pentapeptide repeats